MPAVPEQPVASPESLSEIHKSGKVAIRAGPDRSTCRATLAAASAHRDSHARVTGPLLTRDRVTPEEPSPDADRNADTAAGKLRAETAKHNVTMLFKQLGDYIGAQINSCRISGSHKSGQLTL